MIIVAITRILIDGVVSAFRLSAGGRVIRFLFADNLVGRWRIENAIGLNFGLRSDAGKPYELLVDRVGKFTVNCSLATTLTLPPRPKSLNQRRHRRHNAQAHQGEDGVATVFHSKM